MIRAEWTKFRTIPAWLLATLFAVVAIVGLALQPMHGTCDDDCALPTGPDGQEVTDRFVFVHRTLTGDGTITARVASLTGETPTESGPPEKHPVPWAKAGLILKDGTAPGSSYAAVMVTGGHGVRLQYDYVHDVAGPTDDPEWLRLTRSGHTITAATSADGTRWQTVGTATPKHLPSTLEAGLFTTSPQYAAVSTQTFGTAGVFGSTTTASARFAHVTLRGDATAAWRTDRVGGPDAPPPDAGPGTEPGSTTRGAPAPTAGAEQTGDGFTLTGAGDIAPAVSGANGLGWSLTQTLVGTFVGLVALVVLGALFSAGEYRRGLIGVTLTAMPRRARVLAAKAVVIGGVAATAGTVAAAGAVTLGRALLRGNGVYVNPVSAATEVRLIVGTGLLLALCAVLALAVGAVVRKSAVALSGVLALTVLPYLLAMSVLPSGASDWVLRITPAAAFAIQQSAVEYAQVDNVYTPPNGYFPLPPLAGLAVLAVWAAAAFAFAVLVVRRRDV